MRLMGIDYGTKRVGIAFSDVERTLAFPAEVLPNTEHLTQEITARISEHDIHTVVVGESQDLSGQYNPLQAEVDSFVKDLKKKADVRVIFEPEYLTSIHARRLQGKTGQTDASAAAIILQTYIDKQTPASETQ